MLNRIDYHAVGVAAMYNLPIPVRPKLNNRKALGKNSSFNVIIIIGIIASLLITKYVCVRRGCRNISSLQKAFHIAVLIDCIQISQMGYMATGLILAMRVAVHCAGLELVPAARNSKHSQHWEAISNETKKHTSALGGHIAPSPP